MSGGTLVALAADEIIMDPNAVLGPVDPQIGEFPAASIIEAVELKSAEKAEDRTLILASVARKALAQVHATVVGILTAGGFPVQKAQDVADLLATGRWTHDYPIDIALAQRMGLRVAEFDADGDLRSDGPLPAAHPATAVGVVHTYSLSKGPGAAPRVRALPPEQPEAVVGSPIRGIRRPRGRTALAGGLAGSGTSARTLAYRPDRTRP